MHSFFSKVAELQVWLPQYPGVALPTLFLSTHQNLVQGVPFGPSFAHSQTLGMPSAGPAPDKDDEKDGGGGAGDSHVNV